jgi:hypothetical protein
MFRDHVHEQAQLFKGNNGTNSSNNSSLVHYTSSAQDVHAKEIGLTGALQIALTLSPRGNFTHTFREAQGITWEAVEWLGVCICLSPKHIGVREKFPGKFSGEKGLGGKLFYHPFVLGVGGDWEGREGCGVGVSSASPPT